MELDILYKLERAHQMGCSDPNDPSKKTLYGMAGEEIARLQARLDAVVSVLEINRNNVEMSSTDLWVQVNQAVKGTILGGSRNATNTES